MLPSTASAPHAEHANRGPAKPPDTERLLTKDEPTSHTLLFWECQQRFLARNACPVHCKNSMHRSYIADHIDDGFDMSVLRADLSLRSGGIRRAFRQMTAPVNVDIRMCRSPGTVRASLRSAETALPATRDMNSKFGLKPSTSRLRLPSANATGRHPLSSAVGRRAESPSLLLAMCRLEVSIKIPKSG